MDELKKIFYSDVLRVILDMFTDDEKHYMSGEFDKIKDPCMFSKRYKHYDYINWVIDNKKSVHNQPERIYCEISCYGKFVETCIVDVISLMKYIYVKMKPRNSKGLGYYYSNKEFGDVSRLSYVALEKCMENKSYLEIEQFYDHFFTDSNKDSEQCVKIFIRRAKVLKTPFVNSVIKSYCRYNLELKKNMAREKKRVYNKKKMGMREKKKILYDRRRM